MESKFFVSDNDDEVYVWEVGVGNPEMKDNIVWVSHVLACNLIDAAQIAQELAESTDEPQIIQWVKLTDPVGVRAASNVNLLPPKEWKEWRSQKRDEHINRWNPDRKEVQT